MNKSAKFNVGYIFAISMVSAMGGLLFGYDWVVIGGAKPFYEKFFDIANSPSLQGLAMSSALIGCLLGAVMSGGLSDKYGRKKLLVTSAALFMVSAVGAGLVNGFTAFVIFRAIGGIGIGLASNLSPMYIAEISPANMRGKFVSLNQLTIVIGILGAQIVNYLIADPVPQGATAQEILHSWNGQMGWRWMFWAAAVPASAFFVLMFLVPESPRWLGKVGKFDKVRLILAKVGGLEYADNEVSEIKNSLTDASEKVDYKDLIKPGYSKILILGIVLAVFQQWCGINVIFNYAEEIFMAAGYGVSDILLNIVLTGSVNLIFTFVAIYTVDRLGRKTLMRIGAGSLAAVYLIMGVAYLFDIKGTLLLFLVVFAISCYAMSLGPVTWVVLSEIFPNKVRGTGMSIATFALWTACFVLTYTFPLLNLGLGASGTFALYGIICLAGLIYISLRLPETKGKTLEEIEQIFTKQPASLINRTKH